MKKKFNPLARDGALRKATEIIGVLNQRRVELAHVEEKIQKDKEEERLVGVRLAKNKQELQATEENLKVKKEQAEKCLDLSSEIEIKKQELFRLKEEITGQIEANRAREEEDLRELRVEMREAKKNYKEDTIQRSKDLGVGIKLKQKLLDEISNLQETKKEETKILDGIVAEQLKREGIIKGEDDRITGRQHELNDEQKRLNLYRDRLRMWAKKFNVQLKLNP